MKRLVVTYDVTDLDPAEIDVLAGEALAQAESSDGHPSVETHSSLGDNAGILAASPEDRLRVLGLAVFDDAAELLRQKADVERKAAKENP